MNYSDAQLYAFLQSEKEAEPLIRIMLANYNKAQGDIIKELERIYGKYLSTVNPEDYYNIMIQYDRLNKTLLEVQLIYNDYAKQAGNDIEQIGTTAMQNVYYRQQYLLQWAAPEGLDMAFSMLDPKLIELTVTGTVDSWNAIKKSWGVDTANLYQPGYGTLSELLYNNDIKNIATIQQQITQGFIQGWSVDKVSENITDKVDTMIFNADRIARTEMNRAANAGAHAASVDAESQGLRIRRVWVATLDEKTRPEHQELDGQEVGADEPFEVNGETAMFPGDFGDPGMDINCRCTVATFAGDFEPDSRMGKNPVTGELEVIDFKNYKQWAEDNGL